MYDITSAQLPASWLSTRLGADAHELDGLRRDGELFAVEGDGEWLYPAWQFGPGGTVPQGVRRVVRAAQARGLTEARLVEVLRRRVGLMGGQRLVDLLFAGDSARVVSEVRAA